MEKPLNLHFISGFPQFLASFSEHSIIKKAIQSGHLIIKNIDLRQYGIGQVKQIDDYQYGPGKGMVLRPEPIFHALNAVKSQINASHLTILLTPQGKPLRQELVLKLSQNYQHIILIAGHYEGFDERIRNWVDLEISIGDYIITNGELAAMVLADAIIRLRPGVIANDSAVNESFVNGLLDYPVYTKPVEFQTQKVPAILLSGHHQKIAIWRKKQAFLRTVKRRPDLIKKRKLNPAETKWITEKS